MVLLAAGPVLAEEKELRLPQSILDQVAVLAEGGGPCPGGEPRPLSSRWFTGLDGDRLLLLLEIPDYLCRNSNTTLPLVVDAQSGWQTGEPLEGVPSRFGRGPDGVLWLVTQWQVEATLPII
ncbi:MAG: hypothetical protein AB1896_12065, partial [Thermodesulfobacteriota bacterium]